MKQKISIGYGNVYVADMIVTMLNNLNPSRKTDRKKIEKMIKDLNDFMAFECLETDKRVEIIQG